MKTTWKLINEVSYCTKKKKPINCLKSSVSNFPLTNKSEILNKLNNYYINVVYVVYVNTDPLVKTLHFIFGDCRTLLHIVIMC